MVSQKITLTNPSDAKYLDMIEKAYSETQPTTMMVAVAYTTHSGIAELLNRIEKSTLNSTSLLNYV